MCWVSILDMAKFYNWIKFSVVVNLCIYNVNAKRTSRFFSKLFFVVRSEKGQAKAEKQKNCVNWITILKKNKIIRSNAIQFEGYRYFCEVFFDKANKFWYENIFLLLENRMHKTKETNLSIFNFLVKNLQIYKFVNMKICANTETL